MRSQPHSLEGVVFGHSGCEGLEGGAGFGPILGQNVASFTDCLPSKMPSARDTIVAFLKWWIWERHRMRVGGVKRIMAKYYYTLSLKSGWRALSKQQRHIISQAKPVCFLLRFVASGSLLRPLWPLTRGLALRQTKGILPAQNAPRGSNWLTTACPYLASILRG